MEQEPLKRIIQHRTEEKESERGEKEFKVNKGCRLCNYNIEIVFLQYAKPHCVQGVTKIMPTLPNFNRSTRCIVSLYAYTHSHTYVHAHNSNVNYSVVLLHVTCKNCLLLIYNTTNFCVFDILKKKGEACRFSTLFLNVTFLCNIF